MLEDSYALSPLQQGMLFHSLSAPHAGVEIEQVVCALHENLKAGAFEAAWQSVIQRHAVLRTSFRWQDLDQPLQEVQATVHCRLEQHDWRGLPADEGETRLAAFLQADRRRRFELDRAPLLRLTLIRLAEAEYRFIWTFHHALLDGRSFLLVLKEVQTYYVAFCQDQTIQLGPLRPYRDYIEWLQRQDFSASQTFWQQLLQGFTSPTRLAVDNLSGCRVTEGQEDASKRIQLSFRLSADLTLALNAFAQRQQLTLNTLLQGAWALLLSQYSGEDEVVFGATRACRRTMLDGDGGDSMVGLFINTLPVRARLHSEVSVLQYLQELRAQSLAVRPHEHTPLIQVQKWSEVPRDVTLFDYLLVFEHYLLNDALQALGGEWQNRECEVLAHPSYPLTLVGYASQPMLLRLRFDPERFETAVVERMFGHLQTALQSMIEKPEQPLVKVSLLTEADQHQQLIEWNATRRAYPHERCFHELFEAQVERTPDASAVTYQAEGLTYRELNRRANRLAHHLRRLGVGPETIVGICPQRRPDMLVGLLAILKAGGAYLPFDPVLPTERLTFMLNDARVAIVLTQAGWADRFTSQGRQVIGLEGELGTTQDEANPVSGVQPDNLAYVIYTSGSTGRPKGTLVTHSGLVNYLTWGADAYAVAEGRGALVHSSIGFDLTITGLFAPLLVGQRVVLVPEDEDYDELANTFRRETDISVIKITPAHLELLSQQLRPFEVIDRVKCLVIGGEALQGETLTFWQTHAPHARLINEYGPTETVVGCCVYEVPGAAPIASAVPIGRPIANTRLYVCDPSLRLAPVGVPGELLIGGAGVARGYLKRPALTAEKFIPDPFSPEPGARLYRTGDVVRYLPDGNLEFLGRRDDQVKLRGFRIELGEVEAALVRYPGLRAVAVVVNEEARGGKRIVAYYVTAGDATPLDSELRAFLKATLPDYMVPNTFVRLETMPLTANGKVDRRALPTPVSVRRGEQVALGTETERTVAQIWAAILRVENVGCDDNFFELGGHSLLAIQTVSRLRTAFNLDLPWHVLFQEPTVARLAEYIETVRWSTQAPPASYAGDREEFVL